MVIWSEFHMRQHRDDDHREYQPHFRKVPDISDRLTSQDRFFLSDSSLRPPSDTETNSPHFVLVTLHHQIHGVWPHQYYRYQWTSVQSKLVNQKSRSRIDKSGTEIESRQSRIRKSFSMNDMKSFLIHEAKIERNLERTTVLDSRSPVPVIVSNQDSSLLKPMRSQQLLK